METTLERKQEIREEQVMLPLSRVLDEYTPKPSDVEPLEKRTSSIASTLNQMFPEQEHDEKGVKRAKEILGDLAKEFSDSELKDVVAQFEYLAESWLDDFEREIFEGLTLREVLHERSGGI